MLVTWHLCPLPQQTPPLGPALPGKGDRPEQALRPSVRLSSSGGQVVAPSHAAPPSLGSSRWSGGSIRVQVVRGAPELRVGLARLSGGPGHRDCRTVSVRTALLIRPLPSTGPHPGRRPWPLTPRAGRLLGARSRSFRRSRMQPGLCPPAPRPPVRRGHGGRCGRRRGSGQQEGTQPAEPSCSSCVILRPAAPSTDVAPGPAMGSPLPPLLFLPKFREGHTPSPQPPVLHVSEECLLLQEVFPD